jgi:hypothetical protein
MRGVRPLSDLEARPTKRLLGQLARLRACEENAAGSDAEPHELDPTLVYFKDDPRWQQQYAELKRILATREHVPRPSERRASRRTKSANRPRPARRR